MLAQTLVALALAPPLWGACTSLLVAGAGVSPPAVAAPRQLAAEGDDDAPPAALTAHPLPARDASPGTRFLRLPASRTGIDFEHRFTADRSHINVLANASSGGGVALGDVTGDGLPEVYLTRSVGGGRYYLNLGELKFRDATAEAGLEHDAWGTGAVFVDIDGDGDLDLSVCGYDTPNRLFVNDGDGRFADVAVGAGVAFSGASIVTAYGDMDLDGDLDAYLLTNRINASQEVQGPVTTRDGKPYVPAELIEQYDVLSRPDGHVSVVAAGQYDHLYRNDGAARFTDVSEAAGIDGNHFGLSVTWWDPDADGWPDLYVANDFFGPDRLWHNNGDGTFVDIARNVLPHTPWFSMGSDAGDIDNDGWLDYIASDMAGTSHEKRHTAMGEVDEVSWFLETPEPRQVMRNALYLNSGGGRFREGAWLAGLAASDWTWSTVFGDLDEDGWLDLFVSNGMTRDFFDSDLRKQAFNRGNPNDAVKEFWVGQDQLAERNMAFANQGDLRFVNQAESWGLDHLGVSFGAALDDLDGDGDLDIVSNDFEAPAGVYENRSSAGHRVVVELKGSRQNSRALGAVVRLHTAAGGQTRLITTVRGFMAGTSARAHFGLGDEERVTRLVVEWPGGHVQRFDDLAADQRFVITEPAEPAPGPRAAALPRPMFAGSLGAQSIEQPFDDYARQPLLPWRLSSLGPGLAAADFDGDGDNDYALGGPGGQATQFFRNVDNRRFEPWPQPAVESDAAREDMGLLFVDVDGDSDVDLYVVSGGVESAANGPSLRDRLYLNDGAGAFAASADLALPDQHSSGSAVCAADFDRDGDLDLFVGARSVPGQYPLTPRSQLLRNDGGHFTDVATAHTGPPAAHTDPPAAHTDDADVAATAPGLASAGLVTSAVFTDVDDDGWPDLVVACEWGAVRLWLNNKGVLNEATAAAGLAERTGLWNAVAARDLDNDGDVDLVVTNLGLNTRYRASAEHPLHLWYGDCDGGGVNHLLEGEYDGDRLVPLRCRTCTVGTFPFVAEDAESFLDYARADLYDLFPDFLLEETVALEVNTLESGWLANDGAGRFTWTAFAPVAQLAPGFGLALEDLNGDGAVDIVMSQNFYGPQPETGRFDGGLGQVLLGDGRGSFTPLPPWRSGLRVTGDGKGLAVTDFDGDAWPDLLVGVNAGPLHAFYNLRSPTGRMVSVDLVGRPGNPSAIGARVELTRPGGRRDVAEVTAGSGYLSQHTTTLRFGVGDQAGVRRLQVRWPDGRVTRHELPADAVRVLLRQE